MKRSRLAEIEVRQKKIIEHLVKHDEQMNLLYDLLQGPHIRDLVAEAMADRIAEHTKLHQELVRLIRFDIDQGRIKQDEINLALA